MSNKKLEKKIEPFIVESVDAPLPQGTRIDDATEIGPCFCGARVFASLETESIMHAMPYCKKFEKLGALDFITALRRHREGN